MLECSDGSYYVGSTTDLEARLYQHQVGQGAEYTRRRLPVRLVWAEEYPRVRPGEADSELESRQAERAHRPELRRSTSVVQELHRVRRPRRFSTGSTNLRARASRGQRRRPARAGRTSAR
ncbi:MAG: GIY-YIG nuclease family protein [Nocardioidaceae bacterium]|nr:GIY-YIG nuclease family protein [Nocardioidaceae bacterium]MCL2613040.1 GIY-YIG nuclease family protein [Nocardioidaceae bacterium]